MRPAPTVTPSIRGGGPSPRSKILNSPVRVSPTTAVERSNGSRLSVKLPPVLEVSTFILAPPCIFGSLLSWRPASHEPCGPMRANSPAPKCAGPGAEYVLSSGAAPSSTRELARSRDACRRGPPRHSCRSAPCRQAPIDAPERAAETLSDPSRSARTGAHRHACGWRRALGDVDDSCSGRRRRRYGFSVSAEALDVEADGRSHEFLDFRRT